MKLKTLTLGLILGGIASRLFFNMRQAANRDPWAGYERPEASSLFLGTGGFPHSDNSATGVPGVGMDSPNAAERLESMGVSGSPLGRAAIDKELFASASQDGAGARSPGLSDFLRGG